jgi:hypothetical protein
MWSCRTESRDDEWVSIRTVWRRWIQTYRQLEVDGYDRGLRLWIRLGINHDYLVDGSVEVTRRPVGSAVDFRVHIAGGE